MAVVATVHAPAFVPWPRLSAVNQTVIIDMTSTVKYHGDAGIGRAVASLGLIPDFVDAGVIETTGDELGGGIPR